MVLAFEPAALLLDRWVSGEWSGTMVLLEVSVSGRIFGFGGLLEMVWEDGASGSDWCY